MKEEEFEYGEEVMVRDHDTEEWKKAYYMMTAPKGRKLHWAVTFPLMKEWIDKEKATWVCPFAQIRKVEKAEPQPEPANKPEPIEHWVGRIQTQVMSLMDRVGKIEDVLQSEPELIEQHDSQSDTTTPDKSVTKRKLLNKVVSNIMMMDHEGLIEYIGEKSTNPHSYELSMGGYLLEINLIDKV